MVEVVNDVEEEIMSNSFRGKRACKGKRLNGSFDWDDETLSPRYGNKRKSVAKEKVRERRKRVHRFEDLLDLDE